MAVITIKTPEEQREDAGRRPPGGRRARHDRAARAARASPPTSSTALPRPHRRRAAGGPGAAELPRLPEVDLHLGQPPVVCHGIPGDKRLKHGDIVNIDVTVIQDGFHGDTSRMFFVGEPAAGQAPRASHLRGHVARHRAGAPRRAPRRHRPRHPDAMSRRTASRVVREYCGHGIGRVFHEDPQVLHYGKPGHRPDAAAGHDLHHRADGQRRASATCGCCRTAGPSSPRTTRCPRSGSTRCS